MISKMWILIMAVLILSGCKINSGAEEPVIEEGEPLQIVATTTHVSDLIQQIGGDLVEVETLMGPGVDPHDYSASTSDIRYLDETNVIAYNGLNLEAQFTDIFGQLEQAGTNMVVVEDAISEDYYLNSEEEDLVHDPHVWFSIDLWKDATNHFADQLSNLDPANEETYQENAEAYLEDLDQLKAESEEKIEQINPEQRVLVTAHDAFQYFGEEFGFEVVGIQGLNTQSEAGTGDISNIADYIVENQIPAVFVETSVSSRNVQALIEAVEARGETLALGGELYSDSLGTAEEGTDTYISMYEHNVDTIVDALAEN